MVSGMSDVFVSIVLIIFPILMYLVFSCFNALANNRIEKTVFILTMVTAVYMSLNCNLHQKELLIFCNIPILICYVKKEGLLAAILSVIVALFSYIKYDINIYVVLIKYLSYLLVYIAFCRKKEFNYLFLKLSAVIQGLFISLEYFMNIDRIFYLIAYILIIYALTFFSLYLFKIADNISCLYLTGRQVQEENKLKNSLFKLTHEIKNPIAVCKGYLDMINLDDSDKSRRYISIIKSEIDRSLNVMSDFMEYSKIKVNKEIIDIVMLLDEVYESFEILLKNKMITFNYRSDYEEVYLYGDYDRLKQVCVNVIKNSIESICDGGIISIDVSKTEKEAMIIISDNGIGMNEEELSLVKEMFYTTKKNGTGLGIALSNEIIVAHGGTMTYESEKGIGTKCIIKLPI